MDKRAARVKVGHQGQGILTQLSNVIDREVGQLGTVRWEVISTTAQTAHRLHRNGFLQEKGFREIMTFEVYQVDVLTSELPQPDKKRFSSIQELSPQDLEAFFEDKASWQRVMTSDRMYTHYSPLRNVKQNISKLINARSSVFASAYTADDVTLGDSDDALTSSCVNLATCDVRMLTPTVRWKARRGLVYHMDIYASDFTDLESHIHCHIDRIKQSGNERVCLSLCFESRYTGQISHRIATCLREYGIERLTQNPGMSHIHTFQREFTTRSN
ncbi:uncharacterized protein LOC106011532 [Aplysia californica]|uniref:Uncharacterized protein LOC106011532 n=1 Tax=Aplysia californica TaxID=6500 RepID=A0ABM0ZYA6_APLCA|nr:uncharacterized protein LOC106011532 [Aplysia californica]